MSAAAVEAVLAALPAGRAMPDVLVVEGGDLAAQLVSARPGVAVLAVSASFEEVERLRAAGVPTQLQELPQLLAPAAAYDVVVAPPSVDLDPAGLAELRRVLRPGGALL